MIDAQFRPLPQWPQKPTRDRRKLGGETTYKMILKRLETELNHLQATDIVIETGHTQADTRLDGWLRANARTPAHPGVVLWFVAKAVRSGRTLGPQRHGMDAYDNWEDNLRAVVLRLEALRAVDRYGGESVGGEQYTGYAQLPAPEKAQAKPPLKSPQTKSAAQILYEKLTPRQKAAHTILSEAQGKSVPVTLRQITDFLADTALQSAKHRQAMKNAHPDNKDTAGSHSRFIAVQVAWQTIGDTV